MDEWKGLLDFACSPLSPGSGTNQCGDVKNDSTVDG